MKLLLLTATLACFSWATTGLAAEPDAVKKHLLPENPKDSVITLDFQGGYGLPRSANTPTMSILADGTVLLPANYAGRKSLEGKLSAAELQELIAFIVDENQFFAYDETAVEKKLEAGGPRRRIPDRSTTVIMVHVDGQQKTVRRTPVGLGGGEPIVELQQFGAIRSRLNQVRSIVQMGGTDEVEKWVKVANEQLKQQYPDVAPLTMYDFRSGSERTPGNYSVSFMRILPAAPGVRTNEEVTTVSITTYANAAPVVSVAWRSVEK
ncbi:hypothetical protein [Lignipirellula cremea]|uniref:Uncharacterized protein n=1 Tax=Lignipirellula cremea TaxID=2528010 RepID=A0A518DWI4_9BACT|nr:hypothetical protein [Lignipirellula cremea]QDU96192.1 hypothetical protein Pla8534_40110 [Lignipirellula cremea]